MRENKKGSPSERASEGRKEGGRTARESRARLSSSPLRGSPGARRKQQHHQKHPHRRAPLRAWTGKGTQPRDGDCCGRPSNAGLLRPASEPGRRPAASASPWSSPANFVSEEEKKSDVEEPSRELRRRLDAGAASGPKEPSRLRRLPSERAEGAAAAAPDAWPAPPAPSASRGCRSMPLLRFLMRQRGCRPSASGWAGRASLWAAGRRRRRRRTSRSTRNPRWLPFMRRPSGRV